MADQGVDVFTMHVDGPKVIVETAAKRGKMVYPARRTQLLRHLIQDNAWSRVLVFVATKYAAGVVAEKLYKAGVFATPFHGDLSQGARQQVLDFARAHQGAPLAVRLNQLRGPEGLRDLLALAESGVVLDWLLLPKVEYPADLSLVHAVAGHAFHRLVPLIETPLGLHN
eukprot:gene19311-38597_t